MRSRTRFLVALLTGASLLAAHGFASAAAQPAEEPLTAKLGEVWGSVLVRANDNAAFQQAEQGQVLQVGAQIQTESNGKARLDFSTGTVVRVGPGTLFTLQPTEEDSQGTIIPLQLEAGKLWVILRGGSLEVETETGVASVSGSLMTVVYNSASGQVRIVCVEGHCNLTNPSGNVDIATGQTAQAFSGESPQPGYMTNKDCEDWESNTGVGACSGAPRETETQDETQDCGGPNSNCGVAPGGNGSGNEGGGKGSGKEKQARQ